MCIINSKIINIQYIQHSHQIVQNKNTKEINFLNILILRKVQSDQEEQQIKEIEEIDQQQWLLWQQEFQEEEIQVQEQNLVANQKAKQSSPTMILVFLVIYIIHALLLVLAVQYFFTDAIMFICSILFQGTELLIELIFTMQHFIAGEHIILQYLLIFPKDYLNLYLSPLNYIKNNSIGIYFIKFEHTYIMVTLIILIYFIIENIRSYNKLCEITKHLEDFEETCPICLEDLITPNEEAERIRCGHFFHNSCLSKWIMRQEEITRHLNYNYSCPVCRHPLH